MAGTLIYGHELLRLLRILADGELTVRQIGEKYDIASDILFEIQSDNADKIDEIRKARAGLYEDDGIPGLWIGNKENRVAEHQAIVEKCRGSRDAKLITRTQTSLRSVAEEMGALRTNLDGRLHVTIDGVDPKDVQ